MTENKEAEEMKEFMTILMDVKVSLADQNGKLDILLDMKPKLDTAYDTANVADRRSTENEKDINNLQTKVSTKANKDDVKRIIDEKDNWQRNLPAWVAAMIAIVALLLPYFN